MPSGSFDFPPPKNDDSWEAVCLRIFAEEFGVPLQKFKRRGQKQHGIDLIGTDSEGKAIVIQCKVRTTEKGLGRNHIIEDVEAAKNLVDDQSGEKVDISRFVIATTAKNNDHTALAANLTNAHKAQGLFEVKVYAWCNFQDILNNHRDLNDWYLDSTSQPKNLSNLPQLSPTHISRPNVTQQIHEALSNNIQPGAQRQAAARAFGGYGKTIAALLYAHQYAAHYPGGRFFLSMENQDLTTALSSLAQHLRVSEDGKPDQVATMVKCELEGTPDDKGIYPASLLILDNVDDAEHWQSILQTKIGRTNNPLIPRGGCRLLLTTRAESIPQTSIIPVGRLTSEEAREIYRRFATPHGLSEAQYREPPSDITADVITNLVGGLAVAVAAVAALMKIRPDLSWDDYASMLRDTPIEEFPDASEEVCQEIGTNGESLAAHRRTLRVIDDAIASLDVPERRAVDYAAILPEDQVPRSWLVALLNADATRLHNDDKGVPLPSPIIFTKKAGQPPIIANEVIRHLVRMDVLTSITDDERILSLHRLWRSRVNCIAKTKDQQCFPFWPALVTHVQSRRAEIVTGTDESKFGYIDSPAILTNQENWWELSPLLSLCRTLWHHAKCESGDPDNNSRVFYAACAAKLGAWVSGVFRLMGRLSDAEACLKPVEEFEEEVKQSLGLETLGACLQNLSIIQSARGDFKSALANMERAVSSDLSCGAPDSVSLAIRYNNLLNIYTELANYHSAKMYSDKAYAILQKHYPSNHIAFTAYYSNLSRLQARVGNITAAIKSVKRSIFIDRQYFPAMHPKLAFKYGLLASYYGDRKNYVEARRYIQMSIDINVANYGPYYLDLAQCFTFLSKLHADVDDIVSAMFALEKAECVYVKNEATGLPEYAFYLVIRAEISIKGGMLESAQVLFKQATEKLVIIFGESHVYVQDVRRTMAHLMPPK